MEDVEPEKPEVSVDLSYKRSPVRLVFPLPLNQRQASLLLLLLLGQRRKLHFGFESPGGKRYL